MAAPARHTRGEVIAALHTERGNVSATARRLGITTQSLNERAGRDRAIKAAIRAARRAARFVIVCPQCHGHGVIG